MEESNDLDKNTEMSKKSETSQNLDHLTKIIGPFGKFHAIVYFTLGISISLHCWQSLANKFYTYPTDYWCARPENLTDLSVEKWLNLSSPLNEDGKFDRCFVFDVDYEKLTKRPEDGTPVIKCSKWEYDAHYFDVST